MIMRVATVVLAACGGGGAAIAPASPAAPAAEAALTVSAEAFGPLTAKTRANLVALRAALPELEVRPVHTPRIPVMDKDAESETQATLEYQVFDPATGEQLFAIIPDGTGGIQTIESTSPKITVAGHVWRVRQKLADASALTTCRCRNAQPVCFKQGDRVALGFARSCRGVSVLDARSRHRLEGLAIARIVWAPSPGTLGDTARDVEPDEPLFDDPCGP
jgi:hypothetical protein